MGSNSNEFRKPQNDHSSQHHDLSKHEADYLVPICVLVEQPAAIANHQTSLEANKTSSNSNSANWTKNQQPKVESIAWSIIETSTSKLLSTRTIQVQINLKSSSNSQADRSEQVVNSLADAIEQIEKSLPDSKTVRLVSCGPLALRQYLFPAARRAQLELSSPLFDSYLDLSREFESRFGRLYHNNHLHQQSFGSWSCSVRAITYNRRQKRALASMTSGFREDEAALETLSQLRSKLARMVALLGSASNSISGRGHLTAASSHHPSIGAVLRRLLEMLEYLQHEDDQIDRCCSGACVATATDEPLASLDQEVEQANQEDHQFEKEALVVELNTLLVGAMSIITARMLNAGHSFDCLVRIKRRVEVGLCDANAHDAEHRVVRARGLPWQATEQDIADFFSGLNISKGGVALCLSRQGRRNGEALIQFDSREERNLALGRHKHFMGPRYIEVYRASAEDFMSVATGYNDAVRTFLSKDAQAIVRMRGLPFSCTAKQVVDFFAGPVGTTTTSNRNDGNSHEISLLDDDDDTKSVCDGTKELNRGSKSSSTNKKRDHSSSSTFSPCQVLAGENGVLFVKNHEDKPTGDAFVLFSSDDEANRALRRHHQNIGSRYVELFRSTISEVQQVLSSCNERDNSNNYHSNSQNRTKGLQHYDVVECVDISIAGLAQECWPSATTSSKSCDNRTRTNKQTTYALVAQANRSKKQIKSSQIMISSSSSSDANYESETSGCGSSECTDQTTNGSNTTVDSGSNNATSDSSSNSSDTSCTDRGSMEIEEVCKIDAVRIEVDEEDSTDGKLSPDEGNSIEEVGAEQQATKNKITDPNCCLDHTQAGVIQSDQRSSSIRQAAGKNHHNNGQSYTLRHHNNQHHHWPGSYLPMAPGLTQQVAMGHHMMSHQAAATYATTTMSHQNSPLTNHCHWASQMMPPPPVSSNGYYYTLSPETYHQHHAHLYASPPPIYHEAIGGQSPNRIVTQQPHVDSTNNMCNSSEQSIAASSSSTTATTTTTTTAGASTHETQDISIQSPQIVPQMCQIDSSCYYSPHHHQLFHHYHPSQTTSCYQLPQHTTTYSNEPLPLPPQLAAVVPSSHTNNNRYNHHYYNNRSHHNHHHHNYNLQTATTTTNSITSRRDCIRLRGLPFEARVDDIVRFLGGHSSNILYQGVHMVYSPTGQPTGEAVVQMVSCNDATNVSQLTHKRVMIVGKKKRYIEVIPSSIDDMRSTLGPGLATLLDNVSSAHQTDVSSQQSMSVAASAAHHHHSSAPLMANGGAAPYATTFYTPAPLASDSVLVAANSKQITDQQTDGFPDKTETVVATAAANSDNQKPNSVAVAQEIAA